MDALYLKRKRQTKQAFALLALIGLLFSIFNDPGGEWHQVWLRLPLLLTGSQQGWPWSGGFVLNIYISIISMALSTVFGLLLGLAMMAKRRWLSLPARALMNFLRNAPWLVLRSRCSTCCPITPRCLAFPLPSHRCLRRLSG
ncbi:hypothetical protein [Erwinia billingiae]|uniref:hypothetical protein n=1 Tax=Erwinia billingiae TaxID=182337 RepID=UPI000AB0CC65|nr:hypothetical protein [Erwinia billingiae]